MEPALTLGDTASEVPSQSSTVTPAPGSMLLAPPAGGFPEDVVRRTNLLLQQTNATDISLNDTQKVDEEHKPEGVNQQSTSSVTTTEPVKLRQEPLQTFSSSTEYIAKLERKLAKVQPNFRRRDAADGELNEGTGDLTKWLSEFQSDEPVPVSSKPALLPNASVTLLSSTSSAASPTSTDRPTVMSTRTIADYDPRFDPVRYTLHERFTEINGDLTLGVSVCVRTLC